MDKRNQPEPLSVEWLAEELSGQVEIGATAEVRRLIRVVLRHPSLDGEAFWQAIRAIGTTNHPSRWRHDVEAAFGRMPRKEKGRSRSSMMSYYYMIDELELALSFCSLREIHDLGELMFAMDLYLHFGKLSEARSVARKCQRALRKPQISLDASCLIEAMASYYARTRDWSRALEIWSMAPRDEPMARNAAVGIAEVFIAAALDAISAELTTIAKLSQKISASISLSHPGLDDALRKDTQKDLLNLRRGLERLLPEKRRQAVGFDDSRDTEF